MKRFFKALGSLAIIGAIISAVTYFLHKKGILRVEVNYDDKEGKPVTRELDEIVETTAESVGDKVAGKVTTVASDVKNKLEHQLGLVNEQLGSITVPSSVHNESFK